MMPGVCVKWCSKLASVENSPAPQLIETSVTPGSDEATSTAWNRSWNAAEAASTSTMRAWGAIAWAHSVSIADSSDQLGSTGAGVPEAYTTWNTVLVAAVASEDFSRGSPNWRAKRLKSWSAVAQWNALTIAMVPWPPKG